MKKRNKGFVAISLIYSFFLVFLMAMLAIVANYAHNRILLNDVKTVTKEKLNGLSEQTSVYLPYLNYSEGDKVTYANESWIVMKDLGETVRLILENPLNNSELSTALSSVSKSVDNKTTYFTVNNKVLNGNTVAMCLNGYSSYVCSYNSSSILDYTLYYWEDSIPKKILDFWLSNNMRLQKAITKNALVEMDFTDGLYEYKDYIRIPINGEYTADSDIWNLTSNGYDNGQSKIWVNSVSVTAHNILKKIKPVITVKKENDIEARIALLNSEIEDYEAQNINIQSEISEKQAEVKAKQDLITANNSKINNLESQINQNKSTISEYESQISQNNSSITYYNNLVISLNNQLTSYMTNINNLSTECSTYQNELSNLTPGTNAYYAKQTQWNLCKNSLSEASSNYTSTYNQKTVANQTIADLNTSNNSLNSAISDLKDTNETYENQITEYTNNNSALSAEISNLNYEINDLQANYNSNKSAIENDKAQIEYLESLS